MTTTTLDIAHVQAVCAIKSRNSTPMSPEVHKRKCEQMLTYLTRLRQHEHIESARMPAFSPMPRSG
ncbi:MAG: hypothetical protein NTV22_16240 [bacterium]|nr:hypothetical protein [bacterium]